MKKLKQVTDIVTIVGPALVAVFGMLELTNLVEAVNVLIPIILATLSTVASIVYNKLEV